MLKYSLLGAARYAGSHARGGKPQGSPSSMGGGCMGRGTSGGGGGGVLDSPSSRSWPPPAELDTADAAVGMCELSSSSTSTSSSSSSTSSSWSSSRRSHDGGLLDRSESTLNEILCLRTGGSAPGEPPCTDVAAELMAWVHAFPLHACHPNVQKYFLIEPPNKNLMLNESQSYYCIHINFHHNFLVLKIILFMLTW